MSHRLRHNIGTPDRALRAVMGLVALTLVYIGPRSAWGYLGVALLLTSVVGFCPLYAALGITTRSRKVS